MRILCAFAALVLAARGDGDDATPAPTPDAPDGTAEPTPAPTTLDERVDTLFKALAKLQGLVPPAPEDDPDKEPATVEGNLQAVTKLQGVVPVDDNGKPNPATVEGNTVDIAGLQVSTNHSWILLAGIMCFFLQAGFALLEAGAVRSKNVKNIMVKNFLDACLGGIAYFLFGYAFAYGSPGDGTGNEFSGGETTGFFLLVDVGKDEYYLWFFQWVFAATTATIVSGAVAERIKFSGYLIYSFILTGIIYPWCSHWIWSGDGFLNKLGVAAFCGAYVLGPRIGRFAKDGTPQPINSHNTAMIALGLFILWFGFIPFNAGSGVDIVGDYSWITARIAVLTSMGGCSGGCVGTLYGMWATGYVSLEHGMNGCLCGMVSVCSCCAVVEIWAVVFFIAPLAVLTFQGCQWALLRIQVDDPLGASSLHFGPGMVGMLAVGFFAKPEYVRAVYAGDKPTMGEDYPWARSGDSDEDFFGVFYGGTGKQLGFQLLAMLVDAVYGLVTCFLMFWVINRLGLLRASEEDELRGMDLAHHGGYAYEWIREDPKALEVSQAGSAKGGTTEIQEL